MSSTHKNHSVPKQPLAPNRVSRAALQAFVNIAKKWDLSVEQQRLLLGDIPRATFYKWKNNLSINENLILPRDTLERISYILGIYKALHILLPTDEMADQWIHRNNKAPLFNHQTALEKMLAGNVIDLADIRRYLDAERGA